MKCSAPLAFHLSTFKNDMCVPLEYALSTRYVGVLFEEHLSWAAHVDHMAKRLRTVPPYIYHLRFLSDVHAKYKTYHALRKCILRYDITVYSSCSFYKKKQFKNWHYFGKHNKKHCV